MQTSKTSMVSDMEPTYESKLLVDNKQINDYHFCSDRFVEDSKSWIGNLYLVESIGVFLRDYLLKTRSSDITAGIEKLLMLLVNDGIIVQNPDEIRDYLLQYYDMINVILPICDRVSDKFQTTAEILFTIYKDNEINDKYIIIFIRQNNYSEDTMNDIDQISEDCRIFLHGKSGWLLITTDFKPPINK